MGLIIDTNVFIACEKDCSLLTVNVSEFSRVPGLKVVPFKP